MGLAGRKQKQRIPVDPRNLGWADDASRFGIAYLSKFGWDASKGLGSSGDGMKMHLKVQQKLDMMGIGAQHQRDSNGIAWKQNKDFEALLKRLNESAEKGRDKDTEGEGEGALAGAFVRAQEGSSVATKKRKHEDRVDEDASEKKQKKEKKKGRKPSPDAGDSAPATDSPSSTLSHSKPPSLKSRPMAHRVRIHAAKRLAGKSASAIAEILGIAPSSSVSTSTSRASTPPSLQPCISLDNLTTSTKSVADYFKEKLLVRSSSFSPMSSATLSGSATPCLGTAASGLGLSPPDDEGGMPRGGIGSRAPAAPPPPWIPETGSASTCVDAELAEKQRQKAERKAEKRRRREAKASEATWEDGLQNVQSTFKKEKKREREGQSPQSNDDDATPSSSLTEPRKKSKKGRS